MIIMGNLSSKEKEQLEIMSCYNNGYKYKDIAEKLGKNENSIKTIVNNWINKLPEKSQKRIRYEHKIKSIEKKENIKVINYESKKELGDTEFVLKNRSIYKNIHNGDIVLKDQKEIGCFVSFDVPKRLINSEKLKN